MLNKERHLGRAGKEPHRARTHEREQETRVKKIFHSASLCVSAQTCVMRKWRIKDENNNETNN